MMEYEVARQCAQKFNPPSGDEIARTISNELSYLLAGQGLGDQIAQMVAGELSRLLTGQGIATDISQAVDASNMSGVPSSAVCFYQDGDKWFAVYKDFKNITESPCGVGSTFNEAWNNLVAK